MLKKSYKLYLLGLLAALLLTVIWGWMDSGSSGAMLGLAYGAVGILLGALVLPVILGSAVLVVERLLRWLQRPQRK
ncbi:MAG: hypothetical protein DCF29_08690 [Alphaproteobacteria bacterium]|nr:MAG: hypothetical protein DCF29_08690 [Alphaproteobacteria bacterium]